MAQIKRTAGRRRNLLLELGTEELPPKALKKLSEAFGESVFTGLVDAGMVESAADNESAGKYKCYATPRRLAVWIQGVLPKQPDQEEQRFGPAVQAAFDDDGKPTMAAEGFAKSCGVSVAKLKTAQTDKGERLTFSRKVRGERLQAIVTACLENGIKALPIPKRMRWGDKDAEFVRPVHWLLALYGSDLVRTEILGLKSDRFTRGHRFHCSEKIKIPSADRYVSTLKTTGFVIADYEVRQAIIEKQVTRLASKAGARIDIDPDLLDEVTGLVEWPVALTGQYDERFLKLPREVLVSTMADHQKYFFLTNEKGRPVPNFIAVSNIKSKSPKRVRLGNERVLRARLSDAEFFWKTDQKRTLEDRLEDLKGVLFHFKLGSIYDKSCRVESLAVNIAKQLDVDQEKTALAARLCKADLVTDMVSEFPELQGIIGRYYAAGQGIDKKVANAIDGHYMPRFSGDKLPGNGVAKCVAIADRIDTLTGIFACGEIPTGDKDPFGLRRASLGVLRILIEGKLELDLKKLIKISLDEYRKSGLEKINVGDEVADQVFDYMIERLRGYFQSQGYGPDIYASVEACKPASPVDFSRRVKALDQFFRKRKNAAESLASANKRIANILAKVKIDNGVKFRKKLAEQEPEKVLADSVKELSRTVRVEFDSGNYEKGLELLAGLKAPVDSFFDEVMVMHDNPEIRDNRLALLSELRELFLGVADISRIRVDS
jgi:glycyl-tRNA synthetase beta chain